MKPMKHAPAALLLAGLTLSTTATAGLIVRPGGMVYDSDLDITWLADANYAQTSGYDADGKMNWDDATTWATNLVYGGYSDWRLPTSDTSCINYNCASSELGHLFYSELGVTAYNSILTGNATELAKFTNIQTYVGQTSAYWSGTEYGPDHRAAWGFSTNGGPQLIGYKHLEWYAWAVRPGEVAAVPEPGSVTLLGSGVVAWLGANRKRRRG